LKKPILALGGGGRVAALLKAAFALTGETHLIWQSRGALENGICFDPLGPQGDVEMRAAMRGRKVVFALAGVTPASGSGLEVNTLLARQVLRAAAAEDIKHIFFISTAAVYGNSDQAHHEDDAAEPVSPYGREKLAMEAVIRADETAIGKTILRIGNIAGADQLLGRVGQAPDVFLEQFSDGGFPERSYIGPVTLAKVLTQLFDRAISGYALPEVLNIATPNGVAMDALLRAAEIDFQARPAPNTAIGKVVFNTNRLMRLYSFAPHASDPVRMVDELQQVLAHERPFR